MKKALSYSLIICLFICIVVFLISKQTLPKNFHDIYPDGKKSTFCKIVHINSNSEESKELSGEDLVKLLNTLEHSKYLPDGSAPSVIEGELYHLYFSSNHSELTEIQITDKGKMIINSSQYSIISDHVCEYIKNILE